MITHVNQISTTFHKDNCLFYNICWWKQFCWLATKYTHDMSHWQHNRKCRDTELTYLRPASRCCGSLISRWWRHRCCWWCSAGSLGNGCRGNSRLVGLHIVVRIVKWLESAWWCQSRWSLPCDALRHSALPPSLVCLTQRYLTTEHNNNQFVFSFLRQPQMWHCSHLRLPAAMALLLRGTQRTPLSINISCTHGAQQQTRRRGMKMMVWTNRQTNSFIDPAPHNMRPVRITSCCSNDSKRLHHCCHLLSMVEYTEIECMPNISYTIQWARRRPAKLPLSPGYPLLGIPPT